MSVKLERLKPLVRGLLCFTLVVYGLPTLWALYLDITGQRDVPLFLYVWGFGAVTAALLVDRHAQKSGRKAA